MTNRLAVFDCDGTLVDGQGAVCAAMETAFAAAGLAAPDRRDVRAIVGLSLPQAIRRLAPGATPDAQAHALDAYKNAFRTAREEGRLSEPLFDGIAPLLHDLKDAGWWLAVATGKSDRGLRACLAGHGLSDLFDSLQTADFHPSKPDPAMLHTAMDDCLARPTDTVMIGDTTYDMDMARAAGVRAVGVAWGYHPPAALRDAGAVAVARDAAELAALIDG